MDSIRSMSATFFDNGTKTTYEGEQAWAALVAYKTPYRGVPKLPPLVSNKPKKRKVAYKGVPKLKQIPSTKENYRTKNPAGGRKAMFTQSREYKNGFCPCAIPWYGWKEHCKLLDECRKARAELVQVIKENGR